ncbi:MAG: SGNH/GDSL hydrolase family protein [Chloroflexi bacterium]|nr:SGNH/GDSL hydrolase family protein [Chloroflexota bacterium]
MSTLTRPRAVPGGAASADERPRPRLSGRVTWIARLGVLLATVLLFLVALEVSLRLFGPILPGNYTSGAYLERHPVYGFFHVPGYDGWQHSSEYFARVHFNRLGLRDRRESYDKPPGTFRILLLGDSFMEGVQVEQQQTTAALLEASLRRERPDLNVEVVNAGVAGWGTGIEYLYFDHEGYRFQPDLVLVGFFIGNDLHDNYYKLQLEGDDLDQAVKPYFKLAPDGGLERKDPPPAPPRPGGLVTALRACCRLWNVVETGAINRLSNPQANVPLFAAGPLAPHTRAMYEKEPSGEWAEGWEITARLFDRLKARADEMGASLAAFVIPDSPQLSDDDWETMVQGRRLRDGRLDLAAPNQQLARIAEREGFLLLDLLPTLRAESGGDWKRFYFQTDQHWNQAGHTLAARELTRFLLERGLLPAAR